MSDIDKEIIQYRMFVTGQACPIPDKKYNILFYNSLIFRN